MGIAHPDNELDARSAAKEGTVALTLSSYGVTFATRERALTIVGGLPDANEVAVDFTSTKAASPGFVDGLLGALAARATRVTVSCPDPALASLVGRIIARRNDATEFVLHRGVRT